MDGSFLDSNDPYEVLQISRDSDLRTAKKAHAKLIKIYKPHTHPENFQKIQAAFERVKDLIQDGPGEILHWEQVRVFVEHDEAPPLQTQREEKQNNQTFLDTDDPQACRELLEAAIESEQRIADFYLYGFLLEESLGRPMKEKFAWFKQGFVKKAKFQSVHFEIFNDLEIFQLVQSELFTIEEILCFSSSSRNYAFLKLWALSKIQQDDVDHIFGLFASELFQGALIDDPGLAEPICAICLSLIWQRPEDTMQVFLELVGDYHSFEMETHLEMEAIYKLIKPYRKWLQSQQPNVYLVTYLELGTLLLGSQEKEITQRLTWEIQFQSEKLFKDLATMPAPVNVWFAQNRTPPAYRDFKDCKDNSLYDEEKGAHPENFSDSSLIATLQTFGRSHDSGMESLYLILIGITLLSCVGQIGFGVYSLFVGGWKWSHFLSWTLFLLACVFYSSWQTNVDFPRRVYGWIHYTTLKHFVHPIELWAILVHQDKFSIKDLGTFKTEIVRELRLHVLYRLLVPREEEVIKWQIDFRDRDDGSFE